MTTMRTRVLAVALTLGAVASAGATAPPASAATAKSSRTYRADLDGDRRPDTITVTSIGSNTRPAWRLKVTTTTKKTATYDFQPEQWATQWISYYGSPIQGFGGLDGAPGSEILMRYSSGAHMQVFQSLTWRNGRLVRGAAPGVSDGTWSIDASVWSLVGYRFFHRSGARHVTYTAAFSDDGSRKFSATHQTYRWQNNQWKRVSVTRGSVAPDARGIYGFNGVRLTS